MQRFFSYSRILATGEPAPLATVSVRVSPGGVLAPIFSDQIGTPKANPFLADANGFLYFIAANGVYDVTLSGGGIVAPYTWAEVQLSDLGISPIGVTDVSLGGSRNQSPVVAATPQTVDVVNYPAGGVLIPSIDDLPVGTVMTVVVECQVATGSSVVAKLVDSVGATLGTDPAPFVDDTQFVKHSFAVALPAARASVFLKLVVTGGVDLPLFAIGKISFLLA